MKKQNTQQKILAAALECFSDQGYAQTNIEQIRKRAKVSIGSLYHHFTNKEILADKLYLQLLQDFCTQGLTTLEDCTSAAEVIQNWISFHFDWMQNQRPQAIFMAQHQTKLSSDEIRRKMESVQQTFFSGLEKIYKKISFTSPND